MAQISRKYPGKSTEEIYAKIDTLMGGIAQRHSFEYRKDPEQRMGTVTKLGISGTYRVQGEEVVVDLKFPMLVPGMMRRQVQQDIERRLDGLFPARM